MIKIALCDDEQKILEEVSQFIDKYAEKKNFQNKVADFKKESFTFLLKAEKQIAITATIIKKGIPFLKIFFFISAPLN